MSLRRLRRYYLRYIIYFQTVVFSVGIVDLLIMRFGAPTELSTSILGPLLAAQASIVAIVLSLTGVGIQIIAPEYSPRLNWIFTENPRFYSAFGIVIISLSIVVLGIVIGPFVSIRHQAWLTTVAIVGAGASINELYLFVQGGFLLTGPDGIIEEHRSRLEPCFYVTHIAQKNTDQEGRYHPLRGLGELVEQAYQKDNLDQQTARLGIDAYTDIVVAVSSWFYRDSRRWMKPSRNFDFLYEFVTAATINEVRSKVTELGSVRLQEMGTKGERRYRSERSPLGQDEQLLERPVIDDLPRLAVEASKRSDADPWTRDRERDQDRGNDCLEALEHVHQQAVAAGDYRVAVNVNEGFRRTIDCAISNETASIAKEAWTKGLDTLPALASSEQSKPGLAAGEVERSCRQMEKIHEFGDGADPSVEIPDGLQERIFIFRYIEMVGDICATSSIRDLDNRTRVETIRRNDSEYPSGVNDSENSETLELATNLFDGLCRSVELAGHFENTDKSAPKGREVRTTLTEVCQAVLQTSHSPLTQPLVRIYLEAAFLLSSSQEPRRRWLRSFENLVEADQGEVQETLEYLEHGISGDSPVTLKSILKRPNGGPCLTSEEFSNHLELFLEEAEENTTATVDKMERN